MEYFVYILTSEKFYHRCYIGVSGDIERRLKEHNRGDSEYTKKYAPWKLRTYISFEKKNKAEEFEKYLKSGSGFAFLRKRFL